MALSPPITLVDGVTVNDTNQAVYTTPDNTSTLITHATVHNTTGATRLLTVWVGDDATDPFKRFRRAVAANETLDIDGILGMSLAGGAIITVVADVAAALSISISGTEFPIA